MADAVSVESLSRNYGDRLALDGVSFRVSAGECLGILGPNGGGKTTLFRILVTLLTPSAGRACICGLDVTIERHAARRRIGVVFQSPSLDVHLTARENLRHAGHLYGLSGASLEDRVVDNLQRLDLADRADDLVKTLSGGLRRRVELAKAVLHQPAVLILDEPSTGLDPSARRQFWQELQELRRRTGVTILLTTHFIEEADRCDLVAILDRGRMVASGSPAELKGRIGGDCITIQCDHAADLSERISRGLNCRCRLVEGDIRIEALEGPVLIARLMNAFAADVRAVTLGRPTLEDVFMQETGHRFEGGGALKEEVG